MKKKIKKLIEERQSAPRKTMTPARARELAALRRHRGAGPGRPRSDKLRCFCGKMTFARAIARNHQCEEPSLQEAI